MNFQLRGVYIKDIAILNHGFCSVVRELNVTIKLKYHTGRIIFIGNLFTHGGGITYMLANQTARVFNTMHHNQYGSKIYSGSGIN